MKKFLAKDNSIVALETREDLQKYLDFRKANDEWIHCFINEMGCVGIPNEPLFYDQYCKGIELKRNGYIMCLPDIDYAGESEIECIESNGLFLVIPHKGVTKALPTRDIALPSIFSRAEDFCGTMTRMEPKSGKKVLPIEEKAERLSRDFQLYSGEAKVLYRDGKISAALSSQYQILPSDELVEVMETNLKKDFPDLEFAGGEVSHEYLLATYYLNCQMMEDNFKVQMEQSGYKADNFRAGIRFSTSDVGLSKAYCTLFYEMDGTQVILGSGASLTHNNDNTIADFAQQCDEVAIVFKECEHRIEELGNMDITDVGFVVAEIRDRYSFLPTKIGQEVQDECDLKYVNGGTGIDVYIALNEIVSRHLLNTKVSPANQLAIWEQVSKLINLPFDDIDQGKDWKKI